MTTSKLQLAELKNEKLTVMRGRSASVPPLPSGARKQHVVWHEIAISTIAGSRGLGAQLRNARRGEDVDHLLSAPCFSARRSAVGCILV